MTTCMPGKELSIWLTLSRIFVAPPSVTAQYRDPVFRPFHSPSFINLTTLASTLLVGSVFYLL